MIFADKLIELRKKNGFSQESFAEKMGVSRQAVSKWESAQSVPDLDKILKMSELFSVTTDYLLKDSIENVETIDSEDTILRKVTLEDANKFIKIRKENVKIKILGILMFFLSPMPLLLIWSHGEWYESHDMKFTFIGIFVLLLLMAFSIGFFIIALNNEKPFSFIKHEEIGPEYGVIGMAQKYMGEYRPSYLRTVIVGVLLLLLSPVPTMLGAFSNYQADSKGLLGLAFSILIFGISLAITFFACNINNTYKMLLQ